MIFSVIVPFLNEELYIEKCIRALLNQDFDRRMYELIFIDNGSVDSSRKIVQKFTNVMLLREDKKTAYAARNKGLKVAKGEVVAFIDADCIAARDWLSQIDEGMKKTGAAVVLGRRCFPSNVSYLLRMFEDYENAKIEHLLNKCKKRYFFAYTNNMAVRGDVFRRLGPFMEWPRGGDSEFIQRCIVEEPGSKAVYLNKMKIIHLEIVDLKSWLKKINIYAAHFTQIRKLPIYSNLDYRIKLQICGYCARKNNYTIWQSALFFFLLILGDLYYKGGALKGRLNRSADYRGRKG